MELTEYSRKLDTAGRLVIPIKLRERLHMESGQEYQFLIHEQDGKTYLCIECANEIDLDEVKEYLEKRGLTIAPKS